ncbi:MULTISPECIES: prepilin peptidase [Pseudomonas]|jgi:prepilin peptidase CpaA|uniref:Peptidase A24 n=1 Tax=Pseudomonas mosselii TaxID=78327 RepID=A0A5R8ZG92_9PSED|nr:prepilin peptidase [Pseudomonas mosselii]TLP64761.1 peptidase A24 [Pseudomonas mosselii]
MDNSLAVLVLLPALLFVVGSDLLYRRIHNLLVLVLLALWCVQPVAGLLGVGPWRQLDTLAVFAAMGGCLLGAALVLLVGCGLFFLGRVGAGDVKLMAVICLWVGPHDQLAFLIVTALAGGLLALGLPLLGRVEQVLGHAVQRLAQRFPRLGIHTPVVITEQCPQGIPYGLAIVTGAFYILFIPIHS